MNNERANCPNCGGGILEWSEGRVHCVACGRDFELAPVRPERQRAAVVAGSRAFDHDARGRNARAGRPRPIWKRVSGATVRL